MELRIIGDRPFAVEQTGKRELISTPAEFSAAQNKSILERDAAVAVCRADAERLQQQIEDALLSGEPTEKLRAELVATREQEDTLCDCIGEAQEAINNLFRMIDQYSANQIQEEDTHRLAALTDPYDKIMEEQL